MTLARTLVSLAICCMFLGTGAGAAEPAAVPGRAIRRSDVVFFIDNEKMYEPYGCTVLGWGGHAEAEHIKRAHAKGVRAFATAVAFRTAFHRVIDFSDDYLDAAAQNFQGKPFPVPWLWDHKYKGQPVWWGCTNRPLYRKFLEDVLARKMATGPDGLHIDDYTGTAGAVTWLSGGFCPDCMAGFRDYLAKNVRKEKLAELGITDLAKFDYRRFLIDRGIKPEDYKKRRSTLPLAGEFFDYQAKANTEYVVAFHKLAGKLRGKPVTLSVNSGLNSPLSLMIAPHVSYFCCEVGHNAKTRAVPKHPMYIYKLADGLDRPLAVMGSGQDHAFIMEHNLPCLMRTWIATSYAHGHAFVAPHRLWCYTKEKGTHWYNGPTEEYAWLYQFIRKNARLLDRYQAVAPVAVVYDNAARRKGRGNIEPICTALAQRNVPFTVVVAGDDWLDYRLSGDQLRQHKAVIVTQHLEMDQPQRELIERVKADGRLIVWPDEERLDRLVPTPVVVEGSQHVGVVVRAIAGNRDAPAVVHMLNLRYDGDNDAMVPQREITLRLRRDLLDGREFSRATLHVPRAKLKVLEVTTDGGYTEINVPELKLWAIVELGR